MGDVIVRSRHSVLAVFRCRNVRSIRPPSGKTVKVPAVKRSVSRKADHQARGADDGLRRVTPATGGARALPLLMLMVAVSLALRSNGGLLYDVLDPAVASGE
jgi:hypothetical protein